MERKLFVYLLTDIVLEDIKIPSLSVGIVEDKDDNFYKVNFVVRDKTLQIAKNNVAIFNPLQVGDLFENKVCNVCHRYLPTTCFDKNQNGKDNRPIRRPSCIECRRIIDGVGLSLKDKRKWIKTRPSFEIFTCPICKKKTIPDLTSKVVLDHDHKTGRPRAWICDSCNTGIGRFKDEIEILKNAIEYLKTN